MYYAMQCFLLDCFVKECLGVDCQWAEMFSVVVGTLACDSMTAG